MLSSSVVFVGPDMSVVDRVDELDRHAHPVADLADAALHQIIALRAVGRLAHVYRWSL